MITGQQSKKRSSCCPKCGTRTHKKHLMRLLPETVPGLVHNGICLQCNPGTCLENATLLFRNTDLNGDGGGGWQRNYHAIDTKFRWERSDDGRKTNQDDVVNELCDSAYVRKIDFFGVDNTPLRAGAVTLVKYSEGSVESMVRTSSNGKVVVRYCDIASAQRMKFEDKIHWFHDKCANLDEDGRKVKIDIRYKHFLEDSIEAILSIRQKDLTREWNFELRDGLGEIKLDDWYARVIREVFDPNSGLWQKSSNGGRAEIHAFSKMVCPEHKKYFRFVGRVLGKSLLDHHVLKCRLSKHILKQILGWPLVIEDLKDMDEDRFEFLKSLKEMGKEMSELGLTFTTSEECLGMPKRVALIPNGFEVGVDELTLRPYIQAILKYWLFDRCKEQLKELLLGFYEVMPEPLLAVFDYQELEALMCGTYYDADDEVVEEDDRKVASRRDPDLGDSILDASVINAEVQPVIDAEVTPLIEATLVEDEYQVEPQVEEASTTPILEAHLVESQEFVVEGEEFDAEEKKRRIKNGQCITCGIQTHKVSKLFNKQFPISSEYVLSGRCLLCNPIPSAGAETFPQSIDNSTSSAQYREKKGFCTKCGLVKTHKRDSLGTGMSKITRVGQVYKGICLSCYTLDEAKMILREDLEGSVSQSGGNHNNRHSGRANNSNTRDESNGGETLSLAPRPPPPDLETEIEEVSRPSSRRLRPYCIESLAVGTADFDVTAEMEEQTQNASLEEESTVEGDTQHGNSASSNSAVSRDKMDVQMTSSDDSDTKSEQPRPLSEVLKNWFESNPDHSIKFVPGTTILPNAKTELTLTKPSEIPSALTLETYFRKKDVAGYSPAGTMTTLPSSSDASENEESMNEFEETRTQLIAKVENLYSTAPIQLPSKYVQHIMTGTRLGGGYYGQVYLGVDRVVGNFAIKIINPLVFEQALTNRLYSIQQSFKNEVKVLSQLNHPNIASLYGYCIDNDNLTNTSLLYELAASGSLDKFWSYEVGDLIEPNYIGRTRLSEAKTRARIALELATVLRYMHEGLGGDVCFHRDIKSSNICLTADFSVRVIDCGLSKYVPTEKEGTLSTAGRTGTPGYTCPQYLLGGIGFCSACDVFSFGIVLCELITGKLCGSEKSQHYFTYRRGRQGRDLGDDADDCVDWGDKKSGPERMMKAAALPKAKEEDKAKEEEKEEEDLGFRMAVHANVSDNALSPFPFDINPDEQKERIHAEKAEYSSSVMSRNKKLGLKRMTKLAMDCIEEFSTERPSIGRVVEEMYDILNMLEDEATTSEEFNVSERVSSSETSSGGSMRDTIEYNLDGKCRFCGTVSDKSIRCTGTRSHIHCHNCIERQLRRSMNTFKFEGITCMKEGCDSSDPISDEDLSSLISQNLWISYCLQRNSSIFSDRVASMERQLIDSARQMREFHDIQVKLSAANGLPCPRLFVLVGAHHRNGMMWSHPREYAKNAVSVKLYLYFVCSHSLKIVSERSRIKVRYSREWFKAIAPALNASLALISISLRVALGAEVPLEFARIQEMDEWAKGLLDAEEKSVIQEAENTSGSSDLRRLVGQSLNYVAEKAASSNPNWQSELVPVFDYAKNEATYVLKQYANDSRYQRVAG